MQVLFSMAKFRLYLKNNEKSLGGFEKKSNVIQPRFLEDRSSCHVEKVVTWLHFWRKHYVKT